MGRLVPWVIVAGLLALAAGSNTAAQQPRLAVLNPSLSRPPLSCATEPPEEQRFDFRPRAALPDRRPLRFTQEPALLTADHDAAITLREFMVAGDVSTLSFRALSSEVVETFPRTSVTSIGGRVVSVFTPSWPASRLTEMLRLQEYGLDYPFIYWGEVLPDGQSGGFFVWLRLAPNNLPQAQVLRLADDVQYSASVVNLRIDGFADARLFEDDNSSFDFPALSRKFYTFFEDSYDTLAVTTSDTQVKGNGTFAFHVNVKNDVRGIGLDRFDNSARYGSAGRLAGLEFYFNPNLTTHATAVHEAAHQWGSYLDFAKLGISRAGHQADAHDPLMDGGETLIGAVLEGTRRVNGTTIERTPYPVRFHPLTLYAMGVLKEAGVPAVNLFAEQGQFASGATATPAPGTPVAGGSHSATISNIIGVMGPREGPVPSEVQRAIVVVSSGSLLTQAEMNYWTFFAQRLADPNGSGTPAWDGYVSFSKATGDAVRMRHEIRPRTAPRIAQVLNVDFPPFARGDFRGVEFDAAVPMTYRVGQRARFEGRVTASDRNDFTALILQFYREGGTGDDTLFAQATVGTDGRFSVELPAFEERHRGRWALEVFLFFPGAGSQGPRSVVGPFTVD